MAERSSLLNCRTPNSVPGVRIPPSPLQVIQTISIILFISCRLPLHNMLISWVIGFVINNKPHVLIQSGIVYPIIVLLLSLKLAYIMQTVYRCIVYV